MNIPDITRYWNTRQDGEQSNDRSRMKVYVPEGKRVGETTSLSSQPWFFGSSFVGQLNPLSSYGRFALFETYNKCGAFYTVI